MNTTPLILFLHIPKTGGTTLKSIIKSSLPETSILELNPSFNQDTFNADFKNIEELSYKPLSENDIAKFRDFAEKDNSRIVIGHLPFGIHNYTDRPCRYITMLRKPENLMLSLYHEMFRSDDPGDINLVKSFEGFNSFSETLRNIQTFILSGLNQYQDMIVDESQALLLAKKNIAEYFDFIGRLENLTPSFKKISALLEIEKPTKYSHLKKGDYDKKIFSRNHLRMLKRQNHLDSELYHFVKNKFKVSRFFG